MLIVHIADMDGPTGHPSGSWQCNGVYHRGPCKDHICEVGARYTDTSFRYSSIATNYRSSLALPQRLSSQTVFPRAPPTRFALGLRCLKTVPLLAVCLSVC
eukprot:SAG22_NODE_2019_length_3129_cov_1.934653_9_plen_100_part_01